MPTSFTYHVADDEQPAPGERATMEDNHERSVENHSIDEHPLQGRQQKIIWLYATQISYMAILLACERRAVSPCHHGNLPQMLTLRRNVGARQ